MTAFTEAQLDEFLSRYGATPTTRDALKRLHAAEQSLKDNPTGPSVGALIGRLIGAVLVFKLYRRLGAPRWAAYALADIAVRLEMLRDAR